MFCSLDLPNRFSTFALFTLVSLGLGSSLNAGLITDWKEFLGTIPTSGMDTANPVFGDGTESSAESATIAGQFRTVNLGIGDTITYSGSTILTGGSDHDGGQYRFGIFNDGGQFAADSGNFWTGGWMHIVSGRDGGGDPNFGGLYRGRTNGGFLSGGGDAADVGATRVTSGVLEGDSTNPFVWSMLLTRSSATTIDIFSSIAGGDGNFSETMSINGVTTSNFTFTAGGWLFGGISELDQGSFSNVSFSAVPEPSSALLFGLASVGFFRRRRSRN